MPSHHVLDHAVIGAGVSGLYTAWRLAERRPEAAVGVFEMDDRVGGRLETIRMRGMPNVPVELGGMRIMPTHARVNALVAELGLGTEDFPMGGRNNRFYLRGRAFEGGDVAGRDAGGGAAVPYALGPGERGLLPAEIIVRAIETIVPGAARLTPDELRAACDGATLNGFPLRDHGFWQVLLGALSIEGYHFALAGGGFDSVITNWNACEAICWFMADWSKDPRATAYSALSDGYEALPTRLCERLLALGGRLHLDRELIAIERDPDGLYVLTFEHPTTGHRREALARTVILAMPKRSLQRLAAHPLGGAGPNRFFDHPEVARGIGSVTGHALFKMALAFREPWWRGLGLRSGESVTDLPLRQVYYFGSEGDRAGADPANRNAVLLAAYADGASVDFWESVRLSGPAFAGRSDGTADGPIPAAAGPHAVSELMVAEARRQLAALHGLDAVPEAYDAVFRDWGRDPFGGGWHSWNVGVDARRAVETMVQPLGRERIFVCGEAYSTCQGWVEGALQTAELVLARLDGRAAPGTGPERLR